jgi:DNA-binding transcriptional ArsR family regulator
MGRIDVVLHPVRLRIVQAFIGHESVTVRDLAKQLPDIPQATLYRHLGTLVDGGVLRVVQERKVRGTVERVYALPDTSATLLAADLDNASPEDHLRYFANFLSALQGEFARYLGRDRIDLVADGVGYRTFTVNLTDEEFVTFMTSLNELVAKAAANPPSPDRHRRAFARVVMPLAE